MTYLKWLRVGDRLPQHHTLRQILIQEERPTGAGPNTEQWVLCELDEPWWENSFSPTTGDPPPGIFRPETTKRKWWHR